MKAPRGLSEEEAAAWARLAATVEPLTPKPTAPGEVASPSAKLGGAGTERVATVRRAAPASIARAKRAVTPRDREAAGSEGLDSHWDRRFAKGAIEPDFTLDLHGHSLDSAHARLDAGLAQARSMGARIVLLIAGRPRPAEAADRASRRGAIRAKLLDWLAAGPHGSAIAAVRKAHRRHGGEGALYLVLRRER